MTRAAKNSAHVMYTGVNQETSMISQDSSGSDQEIEVQSHSVSHHLQISHIFCATNVFMPYTEGPKMDGL